jgi:two-component system chemotaxis sensor kinase CheA
MSPYDEVPGDTLLDEVASSVVMADPDDLRSLQVVGKQLEQVAAQYTEEGDAEGARLALFAANLLGHGPREGLLDELSTALCTVQNWRAGPRQLPPPAPAPGSGPLAPAPAAQAFDPDTISLIGDFLGEAGEGLTTADAILLALEHEGQDPESVNALFRVFHTIKGVAGFLGLSDVTTFAHTTENLMNLVREGKAPLEGANLDAVFAAVGTMRQYLDEVRQAVEQDRPPQALPEAEPVLDDLRACIAAATGGPPVARAAPTYAPEPSDEPSDESSEEPSEAPSEAPSEDLVHLESTPAPTRAARAPSPAPSEVAARSADAPARPENGKAAGPARLRETLKIDLERVDSLMELIGELIIVESMVVFAPEIRDLPSLQVRKHITQLAKISRDLQDVAMRMRMVPVRSAFQKMQRLVRELSHKTGKKVSLVISGEGTEMDRSMVERIEDPLVHMLRNAVDHGIESADDRVASGKSPEATIRLSAYHEGGSVVIEVADDGRGLNREAILRRAVERGLVREGEGLTDAEIYALIFAPGFSTAATVTEISGRGVGMDVVKRTVEDLRGRVMISSVPGHGSTFRVVLPLTLAIIDGMLVACGKERYIVPSLSILESLQPRPGMISTYRNSDELINVRGELLPLFHLGNIFCIEDAVQDPCRALVMVVESMGRKVGLLVDDVVAQQQVVIKPVGSGVGQQEAFSGAAILSDGRVGLILNIDRICNAVGVRAQRANWGSAEAQA